MSKYSLASHPLLLGFDQIERLIEQAAKIGSDGYPPYNIEQATPDRFRITLAVAGFSKDNLAITLEARALVIRGVQSDPDKDTVFLHRGIAARQFTRSFILADGVDISSATMENGLLHIELSRREPEKTVTKIKITPRQGG